MGRTYINKREFDDQDRQQKVKNKQRKHSRNPAGEGMRVINNWSEDDYTMYEDSGEYYENTSQHNVNKRK
jgi:hypothetical protein